MYEIEKMVPQNILGISWGSLHILYGSSVFLVKHHGAR
jgi:hypothetical protein